MVWCTTHITLYNIIIRYTFAEILQDAKTSGESEKDASQAKADRWLVGGMGQFWAETLGLMVETHPVTVNRFDRTQDPQPMGYRFSARWLLVNRMAPKASQFFMDYVRCASNRYLWLYFTVCIENNHRYTYMGTSQNTRYGSRPRTHTRSIPPDPYLDPYPVVLHDPYPWSIPLIHTPLSLKKDWCWP